MGQKLRSPPHQFKPHTLNQSSHLIPSAKQYCRPITCYSAVTGRVRRNVREKAIVSLPRARHACTVNIMVTSQPELDSPPFL
mmetsp:Transcript_7272/g.11535  ORF Transcript_7272/g.11535 Transcript_7272/m.11535 type:complete len:82 (-) Transcript_7272:203-448(-)